MTLWRDIVEHAVRASARFGEPLVLVIGADMADRVRVELGLQCGGLAELCRAVELTIVAGPEGACLVFPASQLPGGIDAASVAHPPRA